MWNVAKTCISHRKQNGTLKKRIESELRTTCALVTSRAARVEPQGDPRRAQYLAVGIERQTAVLLSHFQSTVAARMS